MFELSPAIAWNFKNVLGPQKLVIGSEGYHTRRTRAGGAEQDGLLFGTYGSYDRLKPCGIYWGGDGYWSIGSLSGTTASGRALKSRYTEWEVEGRLGWSLPFCLCNKQVIVAPFGGYGYYRGKNDFSQPEEFPLTFRDSIEYGLCGFLTRIDLSERLSVGTIFSAKWMVEGKSKVTNDPFNDDSTLVMGNKNFYAFSLPLIYKFCKNGKMCEFHLTPFYRYRHYGPRENFPSDFIETRFYSYGIRLAFSLCL